MLQYMYTQDYDDEALSGNQSSNQKPAIEDGTGDSESIEDIEGTLSSIGDLEPVKGHISGQAANGPDGQTPDSESKLYNNALVYAIADKYNISQLKELSKTKFISCLPKAVLGHEPFVSVIKLVYKSTPCSDRGLRDVVSQHCSAHMKELLGIERFKAAVQNDGYIGLDLVQVSFELESQKSQKLGSGWQAAVHRAFATTAGRFECTCGTTMEGRLEGSDVLVLRCQSCYSSYSSRGTQLKVTTRKR
jgi:hypothetical protein